MSLTVFLSLLKVTSLTCAPFSWDFPLCNEVKYTQVIFKKLLASQFQRKKIPVSLVDDVAFHSLF